jgi:4-hydroxybenzoate polyprenyltransferase
MAALGLAGAYVLAPPFAYAVAGYVVLNAAYSLALKRVVYLDVLAIALGFLLRVIAGAQAIDVEASPYLLVCTLLLACYLGFGKRAHELAHAGDAAALQRPVLRGYSHVTLAWALKITALATFVAYVLYTRAAHTLAFFGTTRMIYTAPFAAFGLWRFYGLVRSGNSSDSPTEAMLKDLPFVANLALWGAAVTIIIYFKP